MISNDNEFHAVQERIVLFERTLAEARKTYSRSNYEAMSEGYLLEIDRMRSEVRDYLTGIPSQTEAA